MILEFQKLNQCSEQSAKKILCRCNICFTEKFVAKQNITNRHNGDYKLCQKCAAHSEEARKKSSETRKRLGYIPPSRKGIKPCCAGKKIPQLSGINNWKYNPDRQAVKIMKSCRDACRSAVYRTLYKLNHKKRYNTKQLLKYSPEELKKHLENSFKQGMSWNNRSEWHIDHIKSIYQFVHEGITEVNIINALTNLQPLWKSENLKKGSKWMIE